MGFRIYAESTEEVGPDRAEAIRREASRLVAGRSWLSCEPPLLRPEDDGRLSCGFKPNFSPHPDDAASAEASGEPDGTMGDAIDVLARVSRDLGVDWAISHDESDGPVGFIRAGTPDDGVLGTIEALGALADAMAEFGPELEEGE